ncbi:MAG: Glutathione S-transferase domain protein [Thermoleophilia bacterium]|nr:Glutathione S-transferase domain protein [Thermoleophilia bacterium]
MDVELFRFPGSNACLTVERMLDHANVAWREHRVRPLFHVVTLRRNGFSGRTVPAAIIDGEKVQGSRAICRVVADKLPDSGLLPTEPDLRERVLAAEAKGEQLQNVVRRIFYVLAQGDRDVVMPIIDGSFATWPRWGRAAFSRVLVPLASSGHAAKSSRIDGYLDRAAGLLDDFDALVEEGVLGTDRPTIADFQIGPNLAALALDPDVAAALMARPSWRIAQVASPTYSFDTPVDVPDAWIARLVRRVDA